MTPLSPSKLTRLFERSPDETYKKGATIIKGSDSPQYAYLLKKGIVKMQTYSTDGQPVLIHLLEVGSMFPLLTSVPAITNRYWFIALSPVTLRKVPYHEYVHTIHEHPEVLRVQYEKVLRAMDRLTFRIETLISHDARRRMIGILQYLSRHFKKTAADGTLTLDIEVTHQDIASFIGSTRETVSRVWEQLKSEGSVDVKKGKIIIKDQSLLKEE